MLRRLLPVLDWAPRYRRGDLSGDLLAGVTGAAVLVPQSMAYAQVARLPPVVGLYASVVPVIVYSLLGRSRQLSVGPLTSISIISAVGVAKVAPSGSGEFVTLSATLAVIAGLVHLAVGLGRLGFLVRFVSEPVVGGFLAGIGVLLIVVQLGPLTGVTVASSGHAVVVAGDWVEAADGASLATTGVGVAALVLLVLVRRRPRIPSALLLLVAGSVLAAISDLGEHGVDLVGRVPGGLAHLDVPPLGWDEVRVLLPTAFAVTLVSVLESLSIARRYADDHGYEISADQEIVALGASNVAAGLFQGMVVTGAISRSSIIEAAGARTQLSGALSGVIVAPLLLFATGTFRYIPVTVLSAIVIVAVAPFVRVGELRRLWLVKRSDAWLMLTAFAGTLTLGLEPGILVAVAASLAVVVLRATHPPVRQSTLDGVSVVRFDGPLFYASVERLALELRALVEESPPPRAVVLDMSGVDDLDATADRELRRIASRYRDAGLTLLLVAVKDEVRAVMDASGLAELVGRERIVGDVTTALERVNRTA